MVHLRATIVQDGAEIPVSSNYTLYANGKGGSYWTPGVQPHELSSIRDLLSDSMSTLGLRALVLAGQLNYASTISTFTGTESIEIASMGASYMSNISTLSNRAIQDSNNFWTQYGDFQSTQRMNVDAIYISSMVTIALTLRTVPEISTFFGEIDFVNEVMAQQRIDIPRLLVEAETETALQLDSTIVNDGSLLRTDFENSMDSLFSTVMLSQTIEDTTSFGAFYLALLRSTFVGMQAIDAQSISTISSLCSRQNASISSIDSFQRNTLSEFISIMDGFRGVGLTGIEAQISSSVAMNFSNMNIKYGTYAESIERSVSTVYQSTLIVSSMITRMSSLLANAIADAVLLNRSTTTSFLKQAGLDTRPGMTTIASILSTLHSDYSTLVLSSATSRVYDPFMLFPQLTNNMHTSTNIVADRFLRDILVSTSASSASTVQGFYSSYNEAVIASTNSITARYVSSLTAVTFNDVFNTNRSSVTGNMSVNLSTILGEGKIIYMPEPFAEMYVSSFNGIFTIPFSTVTSVFNSSTTGLSTSFAATMQTASSIVSSFVRSTIRGHETVLSTLIDEIQMTAQIDRFTSGRYVRLQRTNNAIIEPLNIGEIEIYDRDGVWIRSGMTATASSRFSLTQFPPSNLIDGNPDTFAHTSGTVSPDEFFQIDLGSTRSLSRIIVRGRANFNNRNVGLTLTVRSDDQSIVYSGGEITQSAIIYTYNLAITPGIPTPTVITSLRYAKSVRVLRTQDISEPINIAEVQIYDENGQEMRSSLTARMSSTFIDGLNSDAYPASNAIDGDANTFAQTSATETANQFLDVDLGRLRAVSAVRIMGRAGTANQPDAFWFRNIGLTLLLYDSYGNVTYNGPEISTAQLQYEYTFTNAAYPNQLYATWGNMVNTYNSLYLSYMSTLVAPDTYITSSIASHSLTLASSISGPTDAVLTERLAQTESTFSVWTSMVAGSNAANADIVTSTMATEQRLLLGADSLGAVMDLQNFTNFYIHISSPFRKIPSTSSYTISYRPLFLSSLQWKAGTIVLDTNSVGSAFDRRLNLDMYCAGLMNYATIPDVVPSLYNASSLYMYKYIIQGNIVWTNLIDARVAATPSLPPTYTVRGLMLYYDAAVDESYGTSGTVFKNIGNLDGYNGIFDAEPVVSFSPRRSLQFTTVSADLTGNIYLTEGTFIAWVYRTGNTNRHTSIFRSRGGSHGGTNVDGEADGEVEGNVNGLDTGPIAGVAQVGYHWNAVGMSFVSNLLIPLDTWCMIACAVSPTQARLYLNKNFVTNVSAHPPTRLIDMKIGDDSIANDRKWPGNISAVMLYDHSLSHNDIMQLYDWFAPQFGLTL
jgi:hypothetical protein